ncbi:hypothetical protein L618_001300001300 [Rhodococcus rhodochrous J45]|uniref:Uncharacterized protein n=1 Tax=Rhodococcus rhodochrous J45 TaxID=935266 RepID=A0A562EN07_RHORH|nr:hypothetical protein L618_001300001300 [Rhodococcus rhodochrous J45]
MPEVVGRHPGDAGSGDGLVEPARLRVWATKVITVLVREHQIGCSLVLALAGQIGHQERRQGDGSALVSLRGAHDDVAAHLYSVLIDCCAALQEVQIAHPQTGCFAPAEAGVSEHEHQWLVRARRPSKPSGLVMGQIDGALFGLARELDSACRVRRDEAVAYGVVEYRSQYLIRPNHHRCSDRLHAVATRSEFGDPLLNSRGAHVAYPYVCPSGANPDAPCRLHRAVCGRLEVGLARQPGIPKVTNGFPGVGGCDVLTPHLGDLDGRGERLRISLGSESSFVGLPVIRGAIPNAVSLSCLGFVRINRRH